MSIINFHDKQQKTCKSLSKGQLKLLRTLASKKQRHKLGLFLVQGTKNILELLESHLVVEHLFVSSEFLLKYQHQLVDRNYVKVHIDELNKASTLSTNNEAIAVVKIAPANLPKIENDLLLALDGVADPGNLGTIVRIADWYGIKHIIASYDCTDLYNPKTISATMGSFTRVQVTQVDLADYFANTKLPIYGAFLDGDNIHDLKINRPAILLMGSESHGVRNNLLPYVSKKVTIASHGQAESLNVAIATGIILDNITRIAKIN